MARCVWCIYPQIWSRGVAKSEQWWLGRVRRRRFWLVASAILEGKARKLETQLDENMHLYRKLVSTKVDSSNDNDLESGIDQLLKQLQQVNVQMHAWVSSGGSEVFSHTLTRHQEILQDLTQEFNLLHSSHRAKKEHASLLEDFREFDRTRLDLENGGGSCEQALLKERAFLYRNTGQFEAMCLEVEEAMYQVQKVGVSVKKFCSEVMDDLHHVSCVDPMSLASDDSSLISHCFYVGINWKEMSICLVHFNILTGMAVAISQEMNWKLL